MHGLPANLIWNSLGWLTKLKDIQYFEYFRQFMRTKIGWLQKKKHACTQSVMNAPSASLLVCCQLNIALQLKEGQNGYDHNIASYTLLPE